MSLWQSINTALTKYNSLKLDETIDYNKFFLYSIITHSTAIEGSTLTEDETCLLFDDGITAKGKPLVHHLMNEDLKNSYLFALEMAEKRNEPSVYFLRQLNSKVMKSTGGSVNTAAGIFDSAKGDFRLCNVSAGRGGNSYLNYTKIPEQINALAAGLEKSIVKNTNMEDIYNFSFEAHLKLVTIHPWLDGNGRTARLLMNYIQFYHKFTPVKIYQEDKADYIKALVESQKKDDSEPFKAFMTKQFLKMLEEEIALYDK
jgi:Fic family protein